jgi:hypothetical protein
LEVVNAARPDIIGVDSPGGRIDEALRIAREIRTRGLNTFIYGNRYCASACALLFLAAKTKYICQVPRSASTPLMLLKANHRPPALRRWAVPSVRWCSPRNRPSHVEHRPDQMHWLTEDEMNALGIVTLEPGSRPALSVQR